MSERLVRDMAAFSFSHYAEHGSEDPGGYHDLFLTDLEAWLRAGGYGTARERSIIYVKRDRRSDAICSTRGLIDLYAKNRDHRIAVEFDNGRMLKLKSMEKMNKCDADILVGVIVGGYEKYLSKNNLRYSEIASSYPSVMRDIWLIILADRRIELLSTRANLPSGPRAPGPVNTEAAIGANVSNGNRQYRQRAIDDY